MDSVSIQRNIEKYFTTYWSTVSKAVDQILHNNTSTRVSFEQMYSIVYKSVCDGFAERMHSDLLAQCSEHLEQVDHSLNSCVPMYRNCEQSDEQKVQSIVSFHHALEKYLSAVQQITPIFAYMNKFYVEVILQTSIQSELLELFRRKVSDMRMEGLMTSVDQLLQHPFALQPAIVSSLFVNLHCLGKGEYGLRYPCLFARYVPGILPPMKESDIEAHITEIREMQYRLRSEHGEGACGGHDLKRRGDDDNYGPTVCAAVAAPSSPK